MKPQDFKEKAYSLLERLNTTFESGDMPSESIKESIANPFPGMDSIIMEFLHLVYSYDPHLPLNKYIENLPNLQFQSKLKGDSYSKMNQKNYETVKRYIQFFITYMENYRCNS